MPLNDKQIRDRCLGDRPLISPYYPECQNGESYDFRLGLELKIMRLDKISAFKEWITTGIYTEYDPESWNAN